MSMLLNSDIKRLALIRRSKKERQATGRLVLFGHDVALELGHQLDVVQFFATDARLFEELRAQAPLQAPCRLCPKSRWRQLSGFEADRGMGMEVRFSPPLDTSSARIVVLDGVSDPGNVGTIIRTARALNYGRVVCLEGTADPFGDKALRASKGQAVLMPIAERVDCATYTKIAADSRGGPIRAMRGPIACIFGNEGRGLSEEMLKGAQKVAIPMQNGVESLNVAAAAAILLWSFREGVE